MSTWPTVVTRFALAMALFTTGGVAIAQERYPSRTITVVFPYPAGGFDAMARAFADGLAKAVGQPVVLVNRDGAAGRIAIEQFTTAKPDGYTLAFTPAAPITSVPYLQKGVPYRYDQFEYICQVYENTFTVSVPGNSPYRTLRELVDFARANPGKITYGHPGIGSGPHLAVEGLARALALQLTPIPYRGGGQMLTALAAGQIDFSSPGLGSVAPRKDTRVLGLFSSKRQAFVPDVPTVAELGLKGLEGDPQSVIAPRGTPREVLAALEQGCRTVTESEGYRTFAARLFQTVEFLPGAEIARRTAEDATAKEALIKALGLKSE